MYGHENKKKLWGSASSSAIIDFDFVAVDDGGGCDVVGWRYKKKYDIRISHCAFARLLFQQSMFVNTPVAGWWHTQRAIALKSACDSFYCFEWFIYLLLYFNVVYTQRHNNNRKKWFFEWQAISTAKFWKCSLQNSFDIAHGNGFSLRQIATQNHMFITIKCNNILVDSDFILVNIMFTNGLFVCFLFHFAIRCRILCGKMSAGYRFVSLSLCSLSVRWFDLMHIPPQLFPSNTDN